MLKIKTLVAAFLAGASISSAANAVTYDLTATSLFPSSLSGFTIQYDDANSDTLLSHSEIVSFSGVTCFAPTCASTNKFYSIVGRVPSIAGFAVQSGSDGPFSAGFWTFLIDSSNNVLLNGAAGVIWNYTRTAVTAPAVPLPAALPLFATGLGMMGLLGWRRKRKAKVAA